MSTTWEARKAMDDRTESTARSGENVEATQLRARARLLCQPIPDVYAWDPAAIGSLVGGTVLSGFCVFVLITGYLMLHTLLIALFGGPMLVIGLYYALAPLRFHRRARHVEYLVTPESATILYRDRVARQYPLDAFTGASVVIRRRPDGSGNITLPTTVAGPSSSGSGYRETPDVGFRGIPDIEAFLDAVRREGTA